MKKALIHQSPEERLSNTSADTARSASDTVQAVRELTKVAMDKTVETHGFLANAKAQEKTTRKVEEVKSASLVANKHLKAIEKNTEPKEVQKIEILGAELLTIKGEKGDKGDKGEKGDRGERGEKGDSIQGERGLPGKDGKDGAQGPMGETGAPGVNGKHGVDGKDGSPDSPDEVVEKVNTAKKKINPAQVRGLPAFMEQVEKYGSNPQGKEAGGGGNVIRFLSNGVVVSAYVTEINFSSGLTPVYDGNGRVTITGSSSSTTYTATPSGLINGSNKTYTVPDAITTVLNFNINGQFIHPVEYSTAGTTITFVTALDASLSGLPFTIVYQ